MRIVVAIGLTLVGIALIIVAVANLYNVDRQPRFLLAAYAIVGCFALTAAARLVKRRSDTSEHTTYGAN
jgi:hypothetical protein